MFYLYPVPHKIILTFTNQCAVYITVTKW